jgi:hypothetical protein
MSKGTKQVFMADDQQDDETKVRKGGGCAEVFPIRGFSINQFHVRPTGLYTRRYLQCFFPEDSF